MDNKSRTRKSNKRYAGIKVRVWLYIKQVTSKMFGDYIGKSINVVADMLHNNRFFITYLQQLGTMTNTRMDIYDKDDNYIVTIDGDNKAFFDVLIKYYNTNYRQFELQSGYNLSYMCKHIKNNRVKLNDLLAFASIHDCQVKVVDNTSNKVIVVFDKDDYEPK